MKTNKFFLLVATVMVCVSSAFISCNNDDDNKNNSKELGDKAVESLRTRLLDENGNVVFGELINGVYEMALQSEADAKEVVAHYVNNEKYNGEATTYNLPDERGKVRVEKGEEEGIYYSVEFNVKGIPSMTLQVVDLNYMEGENKYYPFTTYTCNTCTKTFKLPNMAVKKCTVCGSTNVEKENKKKP